ncbi:MAG: WYL domain-containing protein [Phycisphaerae bacterium]|nr:WYL domain-containing protein [Phycisphaerae bacterium]MDW8262175.1 WYL domain-containing protein [Phycisphaerales bacterium]
MPRRYTRIHRLLKIIMLIQSGDGWSCSRLARECRATQRTIYRDLKELDGAGVPLFFDSETGGYRIRADFFLPPVQLTLEEALAISALAEHVASREQIPFLRPAARALAKLRGQLPPVLRRELARQESQISIQLAAANPPEAAADVYTRVSQALARRVALRCRYDSAGARSAGAAETSGETRHSSRAADEEFLFRPYCLFFSTRAWYVLGYHGGRGEVRCLKLNRFNAIRLTKESYEIPRTFSLEKHLGNAWRMIRGKTRYQVELIFDREFADTVSDTQWHRTQQIRWLEDGSICFTCTVDGLEEIVWWVLSMGPHCRVVRPPELRQQVRELARQIVALYDDAPDARTGDARRGRVTIG